MLQPYYEMAADGHGGHAPAFVSISRQNELNERISRWLIGVQQAYGVSCASTTSTSSAKIRRRLSKPYTRAEPHLRQRIISSSGTYGVMENTWTPPEVLATPVQVADRGSFESRTASPMVFRGLEELPEPHQNPLITKYPEDLEEEYRRIVFLYDTFEEMKRQAELRWLNHASLSGMQDLMDIGAAVQRVMSSAQYIVDFSHARGFDIDFQKLFARNRYLPPKRKTLDMSQQEPYLRGSWVYPV